MKNLKLTSLALAVALLSSCAANQAQTAEDNKTVGGSTEISDPAESTDASDQSGIIVDLTEDEIEHPWLKAPDGLEGFTFDRNTSILINFSDDYSYPFRAVCASGGLEPYDPIFPKDYDEFAVDISEAENTYVKASIAGESFQLYHYYINISEDKYYPSDLMSYNPQNYGGVVTPILIEDIVDDFGKKSPFKKGDIVYVIEPYNYVNAKYVEYWEYNFPDTMGAEWFKEHEITDETFQFNEEDGYYPMEVGKSYLILLDNKKYDRVDNLHDDYDDDYAKLDDIVKIYRTGSYILNLGDDAPDSYGEEDIHMTNYKQYCAYWEACKKLYGEYFKS